MVNYNFKNDPSLNLKSSRLPASTMSLGRLFQSPVTLMKKGCLKQLILVDLKKSLYEFHKKRAQNVRSE